MESSGTIYLCPKQCSRFEDVTPSGGITGITVTAPDYAAGETSGEIIVSLRPAGVVAEVAKGKIKLRPSRSMTCSQNLDWERTDLGRVQVRYQCPDTCRWTKTNIYPGDPAPAPASWPQFNLVHERLFPDGYVVQPDAEDPGLDEDAPSWQRETKERALYPMGQVSFNVFDYPFLLPGGYIIAGEQYRAATGGVLQEHLGVEFATANISGGYIKSVISERDRKYTISIHGQVYPCRAADFRGHRVGDWVFAVPDCCETDCSPDPKGGVVSTEDVDKYGPDGIVAATQWLTLPIDIVGANHEFWPCWEYDNSGWAALLDACVHSGTVIDAHRDAGAYGTLDVEVQGLGRVNGIDLRFLAPDATGWVDGIDYVRADCKVAVLNKAGLPNPGADDLVVFSVCDPNYPVLYFTLGQYVFLWDTRENNYPDDVTYADGSPVTTWPVVYGEISAWVSSHLEEGETNDLGLIIVPGCTSGVCSQGGIHWAVLSLIGGVSDSDSGGCSGLNLAINVCDEYNWSWATSYSHDASYIWLRWGYTPYQFITHSDNYVNGNRTQDIYWHPVKTPYRVTGSMNVAGTQEVIWDLNRARYPDVVILTNTVTVTGSAQLVGPGGLPSALASLNYQSFDERRWGNNVEYNWHVTDGYTHGTKNLITSGIGGGGYDSRVKLLLWATWKDSCDWGDDLADTIPGGDLSVTVLESEAGPEQEYEDINPFLGESNESLALAVEALLNKSVQSFSGSRFGDSIWTIYGTELNMPSGQKWSIAMPTITAYNCRAVEEEE